MNAGKKSVKHKQTHTFDSEFTLDLVPTYLPPNVVKLSLIYPQDLISTENVI